MSLAAETKHFLSECATLISKHRLVMPVGGAFAKTPAL